MAGQRGAESGGWGLIPRKNERSGIENKMDEDLRRLHRAPCCDPHAAWRWPVFLFPNSGKVVIVSYSKKRRRKRGQSQRTKQIEQRNQGQGAGAQPLPSAAVGGGRAWLGTVKPVEGNFGGVLPGVVEVLAVVPEPCLVNASMDRHPARPSSSTTWTGRIFSKNSSCCGVRDGYGLGAGGAHLVYPTLCGKQVLRAGSLGRPLSGCQSALVSGESLCWAILRSSLSCQEVTSRVAEGMLVETGTGTGTETAGANGTGLEVGCQEWKQRRYKTSSGWIWLKEWEGKWPEMSVCFYTRSCRCSRRRLRPCSVDLDGEAM